MTYRDDHDAALHRADAAEREQAKLAGDKRQLETELDAAKQYLGSPRKRAIAIGIGVGACAGALAGGLAIGRATASCPTCPPPPAVATLPAITGVIVADGPTIGHWTLTATSCVKRSDGVELRAVGSENYVVWLSATTVEVEVPAGAFALDTTHFCRGNDALAFGLAEKNDGYEGHVTLDCRWNDNKKPREDDNRVQGRIDFTRCR